MIVQVEMLTTHLENGVQTVSSSGLLELEELIERLPKEFLVPGVFGGIFSGRVYDGGVETVPLNEELTLVIHSHAESPPLSDEEEDEIFRDAEIHIEVEETGQPQHERYWVTFLPELVRVLVEFHGDDPSVHYGLENQGRVLREGTDWGNYGGIALDRAEAYRERTLISRQE